MIVSGRNTSYYHHNLTPSLSIKTMSNGQALYEIEGGRFAVGDDSYLILNQAQPYIIDIASPTVVESFCLFFPEHWAEDVTYSAVRPDDLLLDYAPIQSSVYFFERLYRHDDLVTPHIRHLPAAHRPIAARLPQSRNFEEVIALEIIYNQSVRPLLKELYDE